MPGDKVVKFKRASTATYINKSGVFSVAKIDEPRFEKEGLLIEGQRTNYFVKSNTPAEWTSTSNIDKTNNGVDEFGFSYAKMRTKDNMTGQSSALSLHTCSASRGLMLVAIISIALFHAGLKLLMVFVVVCVLKNTMGRFIHF